MRFITLILALLAALFSLPAAAQDFPPRPDGPVLDQAYILPPDQESALDAKLRAYNAETGRSVIVATVNSLNGEEPQVYTRDLARTWGIGGEESRQGVLMVVAPNERKIWISTARGVQGTLTDISTGRIIQDVMIPAFQNDDMAGGIIAGADAIIERLNMDPAEAQAIAEAEAAAARNSRGSSGGASIGGIIFWIVLIVFFIAIFGRNRGQRSSRHRRGVVGDVAGTVGEVVLWGVINGLFDGDGDGGGWGGGSSGGGGFGGFGGGGGGFNGGGAGGSW